MKEQLIDFQTAKLAKEKGFNEACLECYIPEGTLYNNNTEGVHFTNKQLLSCNYSAPTQSLLQRWLREVHGIHVDIRMIEDEEDSEKITWAFQVITKNLFGDAQYGDFNSYEGALEIGLYGALELI